MNCSLRLKVFYLCFLAVSCFLDIPIHETYAQTSPAGYASVSGQVIDVITNQPIANADIKLQCGRTNLRAVTNASGRYEFTQIPIYTVKNQYLNQTRINVLADESHPAFKQGTLMPGESYVFDFSLDTLYKYPILQGKVTDNQTSSGIAQAAITVSNENETYTGTTDIEGNYKLRIKHKGKGRYTVLASAENYFDSEPQNITTLPAKTYTQNFILNKKEIVLSVSVSPDIWNIGQTNTSAVVTMQDTDKITVLNDGLSVSIYSLQVVNPSGWQVSQTAPGYNTYVLDAAFSGDIANVSWNETNHALSTDAVLCSGAKFAGDQTGVNVLPNAIRTLWLRFKAPSASSIVTEQGIEVIITAQIP